MTRPARPATNRRKFLKQVGSAAIASLPISGRMGFGQTASAAGNRDIQINQRYLNIPISREGDARLFQLSVNGVVQREFPLQLAEDSIDYWIFLYVSEFNGQTITLSGRATAKALSRIYQADEIAGANSLYEERNRPQFHFTVKRGWNNDVNGPIFYNGQYHLFWQAFPFGVTPDSGFMYWGHAVGSDLIHWRELVPALRVYGSVRSGPALHLSIIAMMVDGEKMRWCWSTRRTTGFRKSRSSALLTAPTMESRSRDLPAILSSIAIAS